MSLTKIERGRRAPFASALAVLALLLVLQVSQARAQSAQQPVQPDAPQAVQQEGARQHGAGNALMKRLNLTPEQRERLREIRRQRETEARELTRRVRLARRALDEAIYADTVDEALVEQRTRALSEAQAAALRLRASTELQVRSVLTPEQLRTFRQLRRQAQRQQLLRRRLRGEQPPPPDEN
ncbi:MAG TPA: Spy/CpxP family protein refolding chaperone [Pyrinomonadaceae bacterium]|nr:Spy/CpxP family protein refolding chaperone [Pyrinomonadaceae bacterium]